MNVTRINASLKSIIGRPFKSANLKLRERRKAELAKAAESAPSLPKEKSVNFADATTVMTTAEKKREIGTGNGYRKRGPKSQAKNEAKAASPVGKPIESIQLPTLGDTVKVLLAEEQAKEAASIDKAIATLKLLVTSFKLPKMTLAVIRDMVDSIGDRFTSDEKAHLAELFQKPKSIAILAKLSGKLKELEDQAETAKA